MKVAELEAQGWTRRNTATEPRLSETAGLYRELGMEVLLVPALELTNESGCAECIEADADPSRYKVIFTREGAGSE